MISDRKLLMRAAVITVLIALVGVGVLFAVLKLTNTGQPEIIQNELPVRPGPELPEAKEKLEPSDHEFIREVFPHVSNWNLESIQPYFAMKTLRESTRTNSFRNVLATLSKNLGNLHSFENPSRVEPWETAWNDESQLLTEYQFLAYYERGQAQVNMVLSHDQDRNALYAFTIEVIN